MKTLLILISLLTLASCGAKKVYHTKLSVAEAAKPYVSTFEERDGRTINDLEVKFAKDSKPERIGYCAVGKRIERKTTAQGVVEHIYQTPLIVINTDYWNDPNFTLAQKEQVMFHELGHCIKGLDHSPSMMSIMYAYALGAQMYLQNYATYMSNFFGNKTYASASATFDGSNYALTAQVEEVVESEDLIHPEGDECVHDHGTIVLEVPAETEEE